MKTLTRYMNALLDVVNPETCVMCDAVVLSESETFPVCLSCEEHVGLAPVKDRLGRYPVYSLGLYEGVLEEGIRRFKLGRVKLMGRYWAKHLAHMWQPTGLFDKVDMMCPVPISRKRMYERGFNQSAVLVQALSDWVDVPYRELLTRHRHSEAQMTLSQEERLRNVEGVYRMNGRPDIEKQTILLLDDVITTGATMNECIRTLRAYDASCEIFLMTLARV